MDTFDDGIGFENEIEIFGGGGENGTVVAETMTEPGKAVGFKIPGPAVDPDVLMGSGGIHEWADRPRRSRMQVLALKSE